MKYFFLINIILFVLNVKAFLLKPKKETHQNRSISTHNKENIMENISISLNFNDNSSNKTDTKQVFLPMSYKEKSNSPYIRPKILISPNENIINKQNSDSFVNNESYFQSFYSNYFRKYYQNLGQMASSNDPEGSVLENPHISNHFLAKARVKSPNLNLYPYQIVKQKGDCGCKAEKASFCDCDEIEMGKPLEMPPIILPIIQPIIREIPLKRDILENRPLCEEDLNECDSFCKGTRGKKRERDCDCGCGKRGENENEKDVNVNNANTNNANLLTQKNTVNKIENLYAANYSTTNFNHHIHNYIQGGDFKFKEKISYNNNYSRKDNCTNETTKEKDFYPEIKIINRIFPEKGIKKKSDYTIMTKIDRKVLQNVFSKEQTKEIQNNIKENFTGVMNQAIENTIKSLKSPI